MSSKQEIQEYVLNLVCEITEKNFSWEDIKNKSFFDVNVGLAARDLLFIVIKCEENFDFEFPEEALTSHSIHHILEFCNFMYSYIDGN